MIDRVRYLIVMFAACSGTQHPRSSQGSIAGLARDHDSGEPVQSAEIHIRAQGEMIGQVVRSNRDGTYGIEHLTPGGYSLTAQFAGQPIDIENIQVRGGTPTIVDVEFTLGRPDPVTIDFGDPKPAEIDRYRAPRHVDVGLIEGTIRDSSTHDRIAGAVVTAIGPGAGPYVPTLQTVSDDQGRYRFDPVPPGTYIVSAYYSIGGRGQMEVRRSDIRVAATEGVIVPLLIETTQLNQ